MEGWQKTGCVLCAQNCGLEVLIQDNRILRSRPDKDNPRSQGYACRKGLNVAYHQHHGQRLTHPLKRVDGGFQPISWDQALDEIAVKLRAVVDGHGPRALAYMGGGGQGCHFEAAFGVRLLRGLGSHYHYSPLAQELTGAFWGWGRVLGRQHMHAIPDLPRTDMLVAVGWNGWMSHQVPQARRVLDRLARDPDKLLVVIDPRRSETARRADIHLALRPGSDALLTRAMTAIVLQNGWHDQTYLDAHVADFAQVEPWFQGFDPREAVKVCGLDYAQVEEVCRLMGQRSWSLRPDLGVYMNRHSTLTTFLQMALLAICGRIGVPGGNIIPGQVMAMGSHSDERDPRTWRAMASGFPAIMGTFPPNVLPEEVLSDHPQRLRALLVSQANPLRSYADTTAYEKACKELDLMVVVDLAFTETAALAHYVLPARSGYESWDSTFFSHNWPEIYFQMRRPLIKPQGEPLETGEIMLRLAERLGLVTEIPENLHQAARGDRLSYGMALWQYGQAHPEALAAMPFVVGKTLGPVLGSVHLAALWGLLMTAPKSFQACAARLGFKPGPALGEAVFQAILDNPQGLWVGMSDTSNNLAEVRHPDHRLHVFAPELSAWVAELDPAAEARALESDLEGYPLVLNAGRHMDYNANTLMRDPAWNKGKRACTLAMHPEDAQALDLSDGQAVRVVTPAAVETAELEVSDQTRPGLVLMPHGFGLEYQGGVYGVNVNRLTSAGHRDRLAGTPLHRYVPCRVEAA